MLVERYTHEHGGPSDPQRVRGWFTSLPRMSQERFENDFDAWRTTFWIDHERTESPRYGWAQSGGSAGICFRGRSLSISWGRT